MALERECEKCGRKVQSRRFCNTCRSREFRENRPEYHRNYARRQSEEFKAKAKARFVINYTANQQAVIAAKSVPCADCGGTFPVWCMDLDHIAERGPKRFALSKAGGRKPETVLDEIAKCDAVCANCHRTRSKMRATGPGMV